MLTELTPLGNLHTTGERFHHMGHDYYNTVCGHACAEADTWAARRYITPAAFLKAATGTRTVEGIARNLFLTPGTVTAYLTTLTPTEHISMCRLIGYEPV